MPHVILTLLIALSLNSATGQAAQQELAAQPPLRFHYHISAPAQGKYISMDTAQSTFREYTGGRFPAAARQGARMITLRADFTLPTQLKNETICLVFPPVNYPCNIYLNGGLLAKRGNVREPYTSRIHYTASYLLPPDDLHYGSARPNKLAIELLPQHGERSNVNGLFLAPRAKAVSYTFWRNMLNAYFLRAMILVSILIALYFFMLHFLRKETRYSYYLPFALANLFFVLAFYNNAFNFAFSPTLIDEKLTRTGWLLATYVSLLFVLELIDHPKRRKRLLQILFIPVLPIVAGIFMQKTVPGTLRFFLLVSQPYASLMTLLILVFVLDFLRRKPTKQAVLLAALYSMVILASIHDIYTTIYLMEKPYIMAMPYMIFLLILSFFLISVWEQVEIHKLASQKSQELERTNENLEKILAARTEKLKETAGHFRSIFENSNNAIFLLDENLAYKEVNPAYIALTGYKGEVFRGQKAGFIVHPDHAGRIEKGLGELLGKQRETYTDQLQIMKKNGRYIWIDFQASVHYNKNNGSFAYVLGVFNDITRRKRIQERLRRNEAQYRHLFQHMESAFLLGQLHPATAGRAAGIEILLVNEKLALLVRQTRHDIAGYYFNGFRLTQNPDIQEQALACIMNRQPSQKEYYLPELDRYFNLKFYSPEEKLVAILWEDLTAIKKTALKLEQNRNMLKALGDNLPKGVLFQVYSREGSPPSFSYVSEQTHNLLATAPETFLNEPAQLYRVIHPEDLPRLKQSCAEKAKRFSVLDIELRYRNGQGHYNWARVIAQPKQTEKGVFWNGMFMDIGQQKATEQALKYSEELLNETGKLAKIGGWEILIPSWQIYWAQAMYQIHEMPESFTPQRADLKKFYPAGDSQKLMQALQKAESHGKDFDLQLNLLTGQRNKRIVRIIGHPVLQSGKCQRIYGTFQDITQQQELAGQLLKAKQEAERANQIKTEFIANMSHEIRTPMNVVLGFSEILKNKLKDTEHAHYLEGIYKSGNSLLALINDILDLSKIEAGRMEIHHTPMSLAALFDELKQIFSIKVQQKGLYLTIDLPDSFPPYIKLDEVRLRQILFNLAGNAIKFTEQGGVIIQTRIQAQDQARVSFSVSVIDTGIGIRQESQTEVFEPFRQQEMHNTRKYGGTGLGLAITQRLTQALNGKISLESENGKGSSFTLHFTHVPLAQPTTPTGNEVDKIDFKGQTVLIVDDIESNRMILHDYLATYNLKLYTAGSGREAMKKAQALMPHVLVLDVVMPDINGKTIARRIRKNTQFDNMAIIGQSISTTANTAEFDDFLVKPVRKQALIKSLMQHLEYNLLKDSKEEQAQAHFTENTCQQLRETPGLQEKLEALRPQVEENLKFISMNDVGNLGETLGEHGKAYGFTPLQDYGQALKEAAENYDIERVTALLKGFPEKS